MPLRLRERGAGAVVPANESPRGLSGSAPHRDAIAGDRQERAPDEPLQPRLQGSGAKVQALDGLDPIIARRRFLARRSTMTAMSSSRCYGLDKRACFRVKSTVCELLVGATVGCGSLVYEAAQPSSAVLVASRPRHGALFRRGRLGPGGRFAALSRQQAMKALMAGVEACHICCPDTELDLWPCTGLGDVAKAGRAGQRRVYARPDARLSGHASHAGNSGSHPQRIPARHRRLGRSPHQRR